MSSRWVVWVIIAAGIAATAAIPACVNFGKHKLVVTPSSDVIIGVEIELQAVPSDKHTPTPDEMKRALQVVLKRIDPEGQMAITTSLVGTDRINLQVPGIKDPAPLVAVISQTALLEFVNTADKCFETGFEINQPGTNQRIGEFKKFETILTGADLQNAEIWFDKQQNPIIGIKFQPNAAAKFSEYTTNHIGQYLAVVLDGKVLTCLVIKTPIKDGRSVIYDHFTLEEADRIANQLNSGALPVPLKVLSSRVIGSSTKDNKRGSELNSGVKIVLQAVRNDKHTPTPDEMQRAMQIVRKRLDPQGMKQISIELTGTDQIVVQDSGTTDPLVMTQLISQTALLEFVYTEDKSFDIEVDFNRPGTAVRSAEYAQFETILTGADLLKTEIMLNSHNRPVIGFEFKPLAADMFSEFTKNHIGQYLTVLFDGKVLTCPYIGAEIRGGKGVIDGHFTTDEAQRMVDQLNAGALPVPLMVLSSSDISP